jgi:hypothetical protein
MIITEYIWLQIQPYKVYIVKIKNNTLICKFESSFARVTYKNKWYTIYVHAYIKLNGIVT